ncbi:MAG: hypothetical protein V4649_15985 [Bacteroidota bacterium]
MNGKTGLILFVICAAIAGCTHDTPILSGKGGSATVVLYPRHHDTAWRLRDMKVYVKYNTLNAPANNVYDDSATGIVHDSLVSAAFTSLKNGNYYFFGKGFDTFYNQEVKGGKPYILTAQAPQNMTLPVSED